MSNEDRLLQIFNEETTGRNYTDGQRVLNNDLVSSIDITTEDNLICIDGNVISENLFNEYKTRIELDASVRSILSTYCSCSDYEKKQLKKKNYCCKHLVASFNKALHELAIHPLLKDGDFSKNKEKYSNLLSMLLQDESEKEEVKIEVYINKNKWNDTISAEFRIGINSMNSNDLYILKDINQFLIALYNNIPINYGKYFIFDTDKHKLAVKDRRLIDYINTLGEVQAKQRYSGKNSEKIIEGKYLNIPYFLIRDFFEVISGHRIFLNEGFFFRPIETEILHKNPPIDFELEKIKNEYLLKSNGGMPIVLGPKNDVFLYGVSVYLPEFDYCYKLSPYLKVFNEAKTAIIPNSQEEIILRKLIPDLNLLADELSLSKEIKDKIVIGQCHFAFYLDEQDKEITLILKVRYGTVEFNIFEDYKEKIIYRDSKKEDEVIKFLRNLGFEEIKGKFYLLMDEEYIFKFLKNDLGKLQEIGEVYYSENFKGIKSIGSRGIIGTVKSGKYDYFEMNFRVGDIPSAEIAEMLRNFRDNIKYYKLRTGEYIDLEEIELKKFLKLLESASSTDIDDNTILIPKNKGLYLDDYMENNNIRYIKGKSELKEIKEKIKNINKLNFKEPEELQGHLRGYQKIGYNWFKTLDYLGFGGILGDEMGLGKTLQTIAFLLSNKGSKALIVAPTSLVYNWLSEFEKFAPTMKVAAVNGAKEAREELINNIKSYDAVITTYNLLKRDMEIYNEVAFDYCILDEAQNIKNPSSQNAIAAKEVKAKRRFALSGTPIENSLMELWSIFDFVMPGYLYDEKRFSVRYHKKLRETPEVKEELNRLIKPFILRRRKKEVIKELPDKIETTLMVDLEDAQKKAYKTYADYAMDLIKKKVEDEEFKKSKIEILAYITRLRQICLDPSVILDNYIGNSSKIEALSELLKQSIEEGHRILVFSQFTSILKNIAKRIQLEGINFSYLDGSVPSKERMNLVKRFNDGENSVFLISLKAGGTGLNLTSADVVVHFDPWWNPAVEDQATDRAHRIGQKNIVEVVKIIAKGTVEERILALQQDKKNLLSELMGDDLSTERFFQTLKEEDILKLFEV